MRYALADAMIYVSHNRAHHNVGTCLWHVSVANHHCFKALETYRRREHCPPKKQWRMLYNASTHWKHAKGMSLRYGVIVLENLMHFYQEHLKHLGRWD